jgi:hypothetical protein
MSASRYASSESHAIAKKNTSCKTAAVDRLNRLLGGVARSLELELVSRLK